MDAPVKSPFLEAESESPSVRREMAREAERLLERYQKSNNASDGEMALETLSIYHSCGLRAPQWAVDKLREKWELYKEGIVDGWWGEINEHNVQTYKTFDECIGLKPRKGNVTRAMQKNVTSFSRI